MEEALRPRRNARRGFAMRNCSVLRAQCVLSDAAPARRGGRATGDASRATSVRGDATHARVQSIRSLEGAPLRPLLLDAVLSAGNDNIYKNALVIFVAFHAASLTSLDPNALVNLAGAVFILPFVLLSATSGQLADKFEKSRLIRVIKVLEIAIMLLGLAGFWMQNLAILFTGLALMGVHSTLFGPVKYAILPQHLRPEELIGGNGLVEMGTFVAILLGTIAGGLVVAIEGSGPVLAGAIALAVAIVGYLVSRGIPLTPAVDPGLAINWNPFSETWRNLRVAQENRVVWLSMLGISWFWFYGATFLAQFAGFSRDVLGGNEHVVTFLLALFSIGIGIGSLLCERLSGRRVELGLVPFGSIGLTLFAVDLWFASRNLNATGLSGLDVFFASTAHWRVAADLVLIGLFGGFYIVPLYALIQERSAPSHRSRIIAANNILNALFMVVSAGLAIVLLKVGLTIPEVFLVTALMNAAVAFFIYGLVPEFLMRFLAWLLIHTFYRVDNEGPREHSGRGTVHRRLQSRELRRRGRHRRVRAAADPVRDGSPDLPDPAAVVHLPDDADDPDRVGQGGREDEGTRVRRGRGSAPRRRARRHFSRGQAHGNGRAQHVPARRAADDRDDARARRADGAVGAVGQLLQPRVTAARRCAGGAASFRASRSSSRRRCRRIA